MKLSAFVFSMILLLTVVATTVAEAHHVDDIPRISKEELLEQLNAEDSSLKIIDNRSIKIYDNSSQILPGAIRLELTELGQFMDDTPKDTSLVFYCSDHDEYLSASAALRFFKKGYKNVYALKGGWDE